MPVLSEGYDGKETIKQPSSGGSKGGPVNKNKENTFYSIDSIL